MFVDFPSLQQLGRLLGHSMVVCGILTPDHGARAAAASRAATPDRALLRCRAWPPGCRAGGAGAGVQRGADVRARLRGHAPADQPDARPAAIGHRCGAARDDGSDPAFGLPGDVYVVLAEGPQLEPLLETNERLAARLAAELPGLAFQPPTPAAAVGRRTGEHASTRSASDRADGGAPCALARASPRRRRLHARRVRAVFRAAAARCSIRPSGSPTTAMSPTASRDIIDRFVVRDGDRWTVATYLFPASGRRHRGGAAHCRRGRCRRRR